MKQQKKTANANSNKSKEPSKQRVKSKRGPKKGANITRITDHREIQEKACLELYLGNCMDVHPKAGFATLARYIYDKEKFQTSNGKLLSVNTIRHELTEIAEEYGYINPRGKKKK